MNNKFKFLIIAICLILLLGGSYFLYSALFSSYELNDSPDLSQNSSSSIPATDFTFLDFEGNEVNLSSFYGKPIILNFWASWCSPCKQEMPHFNKLYEELKEQVNFIMLNAVDGQRETIETGKEFIKKEGYTFPVYFDHLYSGSSIYAVTSLPSTLIIDKDSNVVFAYKGLISEKTLRNAIDNILNVEGE